MVQRTSMKKPGHSLNHLKDRVNHDNIETRMTERRGTEEVTSPNHMNSSVEGEGFSSIHHAQTKVGLKSPDLINAMSNRNMSNAAILKSLAGPTRGSRI